MKMLIFSDTHLTPDFDQEKYNFLKRIVSKADKVIINGDFWEGYDYTFESFVNSKWQKLFPLLLKKESVYLYGNHDAAFRSDERVSLFSVEQGDSYDLNWKGKVLHIEHGHQYDPIFGGTEYNSSLAPILKLYDFIDLNGLKLFGTGFWYLMWPKWLVSLIVRRHVSSLPQNTIYVVGHTHWPVFQLERRFVNLGPIGHNHASYLIVDDQVELISERY